ncbi:MAG: hypothetical protein AB7S81_07120 [Bdellovibrionales bacterium]
MSFLPFRLFGKRPKDVPSFVERLETLYREDDYSGIIALGEKLTKEAKKLNSRGRLENDYLLPLLSDMARKLNEKPEHVGGAFYLSAELIDITLKEKLQDVPAERDLLTKRQEVRNKERAFLLEIADNLKTSDENADRGHKFRIYAYLAEQTLDGTFPAHNSIPDWKKLCNKVMDSVMAQDLPRAAKILSHFASKDTKGHGEKYSFVPFLNDHFDNIVRIAKESPFPEDSLAGIALSAKLPSKWDWTVRDILDKNLRTKKPEKVFNDCLKWALQIPEWEAEKPTASFLIEKVLAGVQNPELVPDRKAFEKQVKKRMHPFYEALSDALANLRREEKEMQSPHPTKAGIMHFLEKKGANTLHR